MTTRVATATPAKDPYIPSLDGVRAVAFVIVLLSHTPGVTVVPGGLGVTIFFFLSGFLITTIMRLEFARTGTISIRNFYVRRMLRIFPPMYLALAIGASLGFVGLLPGIPTWRGVLFEAAHLSNYFLIAGNQQEMVPGQRVFWSLAVEEHFYLFFPVVTLWLARTFSTRRLVHALIAAVLVVLLWRTTLLLVLDATPVWLQHATDTRIDSILFGAIMAFACNPILDPPLLESPKHAALILIAALLGLLLTAAPRSVLFQETGRYSVQGVLLVPIYYVLISRPRWPIVRWLNIGPVRYVGTVSYSLYLVHDTIMQSLHRAYPLSSGLLLAVPTFAASIAYASVIRFFVEKPLLSWRRRLRT